MVFILLELRELEELGVLSVPDGLSELSCQKKGSLSIGVTVFGDYNPKPDTAIQ
jgi:hypothetical protein